MENLILAKELESLQAVENDGLGIWCVRSIIRSLCRNNMEEAKIITSNKWDKIRSYPKIADWLKVSGISNKP